MADIQWADWGNALQSGFKARAMYDDNARNSREESDRVAAKPLIRPALGGDSNAQADLLAVDPKTAAVVYQALSRMDANTQAKAKAATDYTVNATTGILGSPPADRPRLYAMALEDAKAKGIDTKGWPAQYDEGFVRFNHTRGVGAKAFFEEQGKNQRHEPRGGGGPTQLDMPSGGGGMPAGPAPRAPGPAMSSAPAGPGPVIAQAPPQAMPPQVAGPQVAQAPVPQVSVDAPPHIAQGADTPPLGDASGNPLPPQAQPPQRPTGAIWNEDPTKHGLVMRGERDKYGNVKPVDVGGHFLFRDPKTNEHVLYKPRPEPPTERVLPPPGWEWDPTRPGAQRPIVGGAHDPERIKGEAEARRLANEKQIPQTVTKGIQENINALKQIDRVEAELDRVPDSTGGAGSIAASIIPGAGMVQNRIDKDGVKLRALIADIGSLKIHDRSGAAVTASEFPRLRPFIPSISDDAPTIKAKLANFRAEYESAVRDATDYYGADTGFRPYTPAVEYLKGREGGGGTPPSGNAPKPTASAKQGTYIGPDKRPIGWDEIELTAKNRGMTTDEVVKKLNLQPAPR